MTLTPIRELVKKTKQIAPKSLGRNSFTYVDISSVDKDSKKIVNPQFLSVDEAPSRARKEIKANDVLVATVRPNLNSVAIVPELYDNEIASTGFCVLRTDETKLDPHYLFYFTQTGHFIENLTKLSIGAGYPAVSDEDILDAEIPLPPLPEQRRIADLLSRADRLPRLRRVGDTLSASLLQSVFLEMFGKESGKKKEELLGNISEIASGVTKGQNYNGRKTVEVPYLRVANVQAGYLDLSEIKTIQALPSEIEELRLKIGDVLMTEGGDFDKLGRGAIWRGGIENCIHQNHIFRVRLDTNKVIPEFFENYLLSREAKNYFLTASKQTTNLASINMTQLKQLPILIPPLSEQEQFAAVVRRVESLRARAGESERQAEGLFQSLLAQCFRP